jgi:hypothetical protein
METEQELAAEIQRLNDELEATGDYAHDRSTGPTVWDPLWEVRRMAYEGQSPARVLEVAQGLKDPTSALLSEAFPGLGDAAKECAALTVPRGVNQPDGAQR